MSEAVLQFQEQSNMNNKVGESRKEIEKLKTELESLITTNLKNKNTVALGCSNTNNVNITEVKAAPATPPKSLRSPINVGKKQTSPSNKEINTTSEEPKSKAKFYDPEATREFIRIKKLRRKEKLQQEELKKKEIEESKKQKLLELRQKTLQLLSENVKKSSSKRNEKFASKSNAQFVNKTNINCRKPRARSFDRESFKNKKFDTKENDVKGVSRSRSRSESQEPKICDKNSALEARNSEHHCNQNSKQTKLKPQLDLEVVTEISHDSNKEKIAAAKKIQAAYRFYQQRSKIPNKTNSNKSSEINHKSDVLLPESKRDSTSNVLQESAIPINNLEKFIRNVSEGLKQKQPIETNGFIDRNESTVSQIQSIKQKLETSISQSKLKSNETPSWLLPPSTLPYPYNFISAVKKKLELAVNNKKDTSIQTSEEKKLNVSIQCSIDTIREIREPKIPEIVPPKPEELKSFMTHKCRKQLVYDSPPKLKSPSNLKEKTEESDSDTTKNIPEISEEELSKKAPENIRNITFSRFPSKVEDPMKNKTNNSSLEMALVKPDYKMDTSKISKSRSKYPSDIESILSQYSRTKSSNIKNDLEYSEDFNTSQTAKSSLPEKHSDISKLKSEIMASLSRYNSSSFASLPKQSNKLINEVQTVGDSGNTKNDKPTLRKLKNIDFSFGNISEISSVNAHNSSESQMHSKKEDSSSILKTDATSAQESTIEESSKHLKQDKSTKTDYTNEPSKPFFQELSKPAVNLRVEKEKFFRETKNNPNQIHLKFQAEVHLLNSFNNSLQQVVAVEKSLHDITDPPRAPTVNFSRGCGNAEQIESLSALEPSVCSEDLNNMTQITESVASETALSLLDAKINQTISETNGNLITKNPYVGVSLGMCDQMIRDEDNRLEHLKAVLKLRDKALFDRTKGELAWLEIQKKQLRENGQLNDVTIIKKKQRGLIIKLEQERHEMQRLKQAHKQAAKQRKNALREQKNIIKQQLSSTDHIPTKIRRLSHLERRQSGPVRVYRVESKTEEVRETTMSKNSSGTDETFSVTSSVVTQISEKVSVDHPDRVDAAVTQKNYVRSKGKHVEDLKKSLLMKEVDLENRRKEAEKLLKWHERLNREEAQVVELERKAKSIQLDDHEKIRVLTGEQLNKIWKGITETSENKFNEQKKYQMSKRSLDKFFQNARKIFKEISEERSRSKRGSEDSYTSDFDPSNSSVMTQINETDLSPNKMLSEKLRRISESSRIDFITSPKEGTNISEYISEKSNKNLSEISDDYQNESDSVIQTEKSIISDQEEKPSTVEENFSTDSDLPELLVSESDKKLDETIATENNINDTLKSVSSKITEKILSDRNIISEPSESEIELKLDAEQSEIAEKLSSIRSVSNGASARSESEIESKLDAEQSDIAEKLSSARSVSNRTSAPSESKIELKLDAEQSEIAEKLSSIRSVSNGASARSESEIELKLDAEQSEIAEKLSSVSNRTSAPSESEIESKLDAEILKSGTSKISSELLAIENGSLTQLSEIPEEETAVSQIITESAALKSEAIIELQENSENTNTKESQGNTSRSIEKNVSLQSDSYILTNSEVKSEIYGTNDASESKKSDVSTESDNKISTSRNSDQIKSEIENNSESNVELNIESINSSPKSDIQEQEITSKTESDNIFSELNGTEISEKPQESQPESNKSIAASVISEKLNVESIQSNKTSEGSDNIVSELNGTEISEKSHKTQSESKKYVSETKSVIIDLEDQNILSELSISSISESNESDLSEKIEKSQLESKNQVSEINSVTKSDLADQNTCSNGADLSEKIQKSQVEPKSEISTHETDLENNYETDFLSDSRTNELNEETDLDCENELSTPEVQTNSNKIESEISKSEKESTTIIESPNSVQTSNKESEPQGFSLWEPQICTEVEDNSSDDLNITGVSHIDVRKRVSEILADSNAPRGDKSPRLQDLYVTTYDVATNSPESTPETGSPTNDYSKRDKSKNTIESQPYKNEAEELLRKQLEIEQEIIQLERQQQQQNIPYLFMREIPNKPPPPYKPPNASTSPVINSIVPIHPHLVTKLVTRSADLLFRAYTAGNLKNVSYKFNEDEKVTSQKFVFNLCKEIALEVCKPIEDIPVPSWKSQKNKFNALISQKPLNKEELCSVMNKRVLQLLNFEPVLRKDNLIIRWSRKKRDHVDEILVLESQTEEAEWTNYDADEQTIKDNLTSDIMDMLIAETAQEMCEIFKREKNMLWSNYC